jgi:hypothetical protein
MDDCESYPLGWIHLADQTEQLTDLIIEIHLNQFVSTAVLDEMGCQSHMTIGSSRKCWLIDACTPQHYKCHTGSRINWRHTGSISQTIFSGCEIFLQTKKSSCTPAQHIAGCASAYARTSVQALAREPPPTCSLMLALALLALMLELGSPVQVLAAREPPPPCSLMLVQLAILTLMLIAPAQGVLALGHMLMLAREHPACSLALSLLAALMLVAPARGVLALVHTIALAREPPPCSLALSLLALLALMLRLTLLALMLVAPARRVLALVNALALKREPLLTRVLALMLAREPPP